MQAERRPYNRPVGVLVGSSRRLHEAREAGHALGGTSRASFQLDG